jgi:hypothetical protein
MFHKHEVRMNHITILMMGMESVSKKIARSNHLTCLSAKKCSIQFRWRENFETVSTTSISVLKNFQIFILTLL